MRIDENRGNDKEHKQIRNGMDRKKGTVCRHDIYKGREIIAYTICRDRRSKTT